MKQKIPICLLMYLLIGVVIAESGAHCDGNTLVYYDNSNNVVKRDCSILHASGSQIFRGICQAYTGGADCWRTEGAVTPDYRNTVRGFIYDSNTSAWGPAYNPTTTTTLINIVTTTTLHACSVCPVCSVCPKSDCSSYDEILFGMNVSFDNCKRNLDSCNSRLGSSYSSDMYNKLISNFKTETGRLNATNMQCSKDLAFEKSNASTYLGVMFLSLLILASVVVIWVKYEWIGDPKLKDELDVKPRSKR